MNPVDEKAGDGVSSKAVADSNQSRSAEQITLFFADANKSYSSAQSNSSRP